MSVYAFSHQVIITPIVAPHTLQRLVAAMRLRAQGGAGLNCSGVCLYSSRSALMHARRTRRVRVTLVSVHTGRAGSVGLEEAPMKAPGEKFGCSARKTSNEE